MSYKRFLSIIMIVWGVSLGYSLSGCIALELGFEEGAAAGIGEAEIAEAGMGMEESEAFLNAFKDDAAGELTVANADYANGLFDRIRLVRAAGESPKLYLSGNSRPFAEILAERNEIRLLRSGRFYAIPENIFSVESETVRIRSSNTTISNIITTVRRGKVVITLGEENGWYQVRVVQNSKMYSGWIKAIYLLPLGKHMSKSEREKWIEDNYTVKPDSVVPVISPTHGVYITDGIAPISPTQGVYNSGGIKSISPTQGKYNTDGIKPISPTNGRYNTGNGSSPQLWLIQAPLQGDQSFDRNTLVSTEIIGQCEVAEKRTFIIGGQGKVTGNIILNKDATLVINGILIGNVYNRGGRIIENNRISGYIVDKD